MKIDGLSLTLCNSALQPPSLQAGLRQQLGKKQAGKERREHKVPKRSKMSETFGINKVVKRLEMTLCMSCSGLITMLMHFGSNYVWNVALFRIHHHHFQTNPNSSAITKFL